MKKKTDQKKLHVKNPDGTKTTASEASRNRIANQPRATGALENRNDILDAALTVGGLGALTKMANAGMNYIGKKAAQTAMKEFQKATGKYLTGKGVVKGTPAQGYKALDKISRTGKRDYSNYPGDFTSFSSGFKRKPEMGPWYNKPVDTYGKAKIETKKMEALSNKRSKK